MYKGAAIQSLDADIIKSVILVTQFYNSPFFKSNDDLKNKINSDNDFDSISKELHPYLKGLLRSHIFKVPLSGDIPDPKKRTGNSRFSKRENNHKKSSFNKNKRNYKKRRYN